MKLRASVECVEQFLGRYEAGNHLFVWPQLLGVLDKDPQFAHAIGQKRSSSMCPMTSCVSVLADQSRGCFLEASRSVPILL